MFLGKTEYFFTGTSHPSNELLVVNYHGTQKKFLNNFKRQLDFFQKRFRLIAPSEIHMYYEEKLVDDQPLLLLNFDDGIKNNLHAASILNERKINAFFFVIPDFIDTSPENQHAYFMKNIRPVINEQIDSGKEDFMAMNWTELKDLVNHGHCIGSHSKTHALVASHATDEIRQQEIVNSKKIVAEKLAISEDAVHSYCSPNESTLSTGKKEMDLIIQNYMFFFSTYPGSNLPDKNRYFIRRSNIEIHWTIGAVLYAIGRWNRWRGKKRINDFKENVIHSALFSVNNQ